MAMGAQAVLGVALLAAVASPPIGAEHRPAAQDESWLADIVCLAEAMASVLALAVPASVYALSLGVVSQICYTRWQHLYWVPS